MGRGGGYVRARPWPSSVSLRKGVLSDGGRTSGQALPLWVGVAFLGVRGETLLADVGKVEELAVRALTRRDLPGCNARRVSEWVTSSESSKAMNIIRDVDIPEIIQSYSGGKHRRKTYRGTIKSHQRRQLRDGERACIASVSRI